MKILVVGNGGREHALVWKLAQSPTVEAIVCVPGNGGTAGAAKCRNHALNPLDGEALADLCSQEEIGLAVIGPEAPLAAGVADFLRDRGVAVFGPGQAGAQIEASKAWAKALMAEANIPTATAAVFTNAAAALDYVRQQGAPIVVKADGLAAGKGVIVAQTLAEAEAAITASFEGAFGAAGQTVVIEECLTGPEISVLAFTDGQTIRPLKVAQDHKRIGEGDTGLNTGGMGAYAPAPLATPELLAEVQAQILEPALATLRDRGIDYRGILYAGLMLTPAGPKVIEFNCRFGDPETQSVLPLLATPLVDILLACAEGRLADLPELEWQDAVSACVVLAAGGYPGDYAKGDRIDGLAAAEAAGAVVFHAGTNAVDDAIQTAGGRVLNVVATAADFDAAFAKVYQALESIQFRDRYYRRDIGWQVRSGGAAAATPES